MNLIAMAPRGELSSTAYVLANPGKEYLVLQPTATDAFVVQLLPGTYTTEWFDVTSRQTRAGANTTVGSEQRVSFTSPFGAVPAVPYLRASK